MSLNDENKKKAEGMAGDFDEEQTETFAGKHQNKSFFIDFKLLLEMLRESMKSGSGFSLTKKSALLISGALAYVVTPTDVVFDALPVVGFLDDIAVLAAAIYFLSPDIDRYREHEKASYE